MQLQDYIEAIPPHDASAMYDFYGRGVHSHADVRLYLATWMIPIVDGKRDTIIADDADKETYTQVAGFRRSNTIHGVFVNIATGRQIFALNAKIEPPFTCSYGTFEELLTGVASIYCIMWGIS